MQRAKLVEEAGAGEMRIEKLLGSIKHIKFTLEYIRETERFEF